MYETPYAMTINGARIQTPANLPVINPANERVICGAPSASREHLDAAVSAARASFVLWRERPLSERQAMVARLGDLLLENRDAFIRLLVTEQGKSRAAAAWEIDAAAHWFREIAKQELRSEVLMDRDGQRVVTRFTPIGVVGAITPWNAPILMATWKIAPALVTGNTMVLKPSPFTPLCSLWFGELAQDVLPPGVLNVISGDNDLGQWMTEHPGIGKISFTGSSSTGKKVMSSASSNLKRVTLELGGNDPAIVMPDVDPKEIAGKLFWAAFVNSAQFCVASKRLYIHEAIYDDVARELVAFTKTVKVGNGLDADTELGPLQNKMQFDKVCDLIADIQTSGQKILTGGNVEPGNGYFVPVTLVDNPPENSRVVVEEAFGPVLPLLKWHREDDVVRRANDSPYGLGASVWGKDLKRAEAIASRLEAGTVWINEIHVLSPDYAFGGHKQSGMGVEHSLQGLAEYCNTQTLIQRPLLS